MKQRLAKTLRRVADRLDPPKPTTPIAWYVSSSGATRKVPWGF